VVALSSTFPEVLLVPPTLTIPAFNAVASVPIGVLDNDELNAPQVIEIRAVARLSGSTQEIGDAATTVLTVRDDDGPTLSLTLVPSVIREGASATATVRRNTGTTGDLLVHITPSGSSGVTPETVLIPDGADEATFTITSTEDGIPDGTRSVTLSVSAPGFTQGSAALTLTDAALPDLAIASVSAPASARVGERANLTFRVENIGVSPIRGRFVQRVFLSRDPFVGDDILIGNFELTPSGDQFGTGIGFNQTVPSFAFTETGDYWLVATTDIGEAIEELNEANNSRIAAQPIQVLADFTATVRVDLPRKIAPAGTPVPLSGRALTPSGGPAVGKRVDVHLTLREFHRVLSAITGLDGRFALTFQPLPGEAGHYEVGAASGGESTALPQDDFTLLGAVFEPVSLGVRIDEGESQVQRLRLVNASEVPLTGLEVFVLGDLPGVTILPTLANPTLGAFARISMPLAASARRTY
jgi:hypothetical protein